MRRLLSVLIALLSVAAVLATVTCVVMLPVSLREFWGESTTVAVMLGGTLLVATLAAVWLRGVAHACRRVRPRRILDSVAGLYLLALGVLATALSVSGELKLGAGYVLGAVFTASAVGYTWLARRPVVPPNPALPPTPQSRRS